jgi:uncharacterized protein (DUF305 family)
MKIISFMFAALLMTACAGSNNSGKTVDHNGMDHSKMGHSDTSNINGNHGDMDHSSMGHSAVSSSPGAADAPLELQFLDTMIVHHEGAIAMARLSETRAERPEVKKISVGVIAEQDREIAQMKRWREEWFKSAPPAINMEMAGMSGNHMNTADLARLSGTAFDAEFVRQMIAHHEEALKMSKVLLESKSGRSPRKELKELAESIIENQNTEIGLMKKWLEEWGN